MTKDSTLKEAGRQLEEEVERQMALWGTSEWTAAAEEEEQTTKTTTGTADTVDPDDPDAMMALFYAKQNAAAAAAESLPVKVWARNIVSLSKQSSMQESSGPNQPQTSNALLHVEQEKKLQERQSALVDHLCLQFLQYQAA
ncbi:expressed unknown protein [Seminavis robusta]|uniref:Uncharacterized protein n=1 Tax=Seminavis robusta TaxID=568900 RepID=A0A9N8EEM7_9STRA|nr:expressed unknown protein [Seminavis robusta]|eukprot:Sro1071_g237930.1 n/a (141) ;mRNA; f:18171-18593